jgi:hypothetical protein
VGETRRGAEATRASLNDLDLLEQARRLLRRVLAYLPDASHIENEVLSFLERSADEPPEG